MNRIIRVSQLASFRKYIFKLLTYFADYRITRNVLSCLYVFYTQLSYQLW